MAPWVNGVKTGHTSGALYVLVGSGRRKGVELIAATVGARSDEARFDGTLRLLEWGFSRFPRPLPIRPGRALAVPAALLRPGPGIERATALDQVGSFASRHAVPIALAALAFVILIGALILRRHREGELAE
jgi:D-alanyl-D-alanine carboxypeptidase